MHIPDFNLHRREDIEKINNGYIGIPVGNNNQGVGVDESIIYHAILPVKVRQKGSNKSITTYAFYDNGSGGSFMSENLQNQLGMKDVQTALQLGTMHGQSYVKSNILTDLIVTDLNDKNPIEINKLFTRKFIPVEHNRIPTPEIASNWNHLRMEIPSYQPDREIGLLIGNNCISAHEPLQVIPSKGDCPLAVFLRHGWTVSGPLIPEPSQPHERKVNVNRITIREIQSTRKYMHAETLALLTKPLYFPNMKYLK